MTYSVQKSDEEWRAELDPDRYQVLRRVLDTVGPGGSAPPDRLRSPVPGCAAVLVIVTSFKPLPPCRGMTFITGPPVSASPRPPEVLKVTSWLFPISTT